MNIETRNMAGSEVALIRAAQAVWTKWTVRKGVADGYQANGWVYRAISIIASAASSVPWVVYGPKNEMLWDHPISILLRAPNPHWTRQQLMELLVDWLQIAGSGYLHRVKVGGRTVELWPVSPDRLAPIPSADLGKWLDGYEEVDQKGIKRRSEVFTPETTIHIRLIDPSNPYRGISPLGAAARAVDLDNSQQDWNVATMQNRGVPDGIFSFKQPIDGNQAQSLTDRIRERWFGPKNARKPLVLGSDAQYQRLSLSPVEMDFLASRKFNREEIAAIYGIPPALMASEAASTYNNFSSANRVLWETTVLPLMDRIRDCLQMALADELSDGLTIGPDLSNVRALQDSEDEKAATAERYVKMGVPFSQVNDRFELGFTAWEGWDKPRQVTAAGSLKLDSTEEGRAAPAFRLRATEQRSAADEMAARDKYAEGPFQSAVAEVLDEQRADVFAALVTGGDARDAVGKRGDGLRRAILTHMRELALMGAASVLDMDRSGGRPGERREAYPPELIEAVERYMEEQGIVLRDLSLIEDFTVDTILGQIAYGVENEMTVAQIQQAILDTGVFSPDRALRIARTEAATAMSSGQMAAGEMAGATQKTWVSSAFETRDIHQARDGETVPIGERFSVRSGSIGPMFPGDPDIAADDRINCRCFMTFQ